jgi:MFS family permease
LASLLFSGGFAWLVHLMDSAWLTLILMLPIGFFASFGFGASGAAIVLLTPSHLRGVISAVYRFVLNMIPMGFGPLLTALLDDHVFHSDLAVGRSVALVATTTLVLSAMLLAWGRPYFRYLRIETRYIGNTA